MTDTHGAQSLTDAVKDITVTSPPPTADLAVAATGPASAKNGAIVTYTIKVTNNGPATATGVSALAKLPLKAQFKSVGVSPASACSKATASNVTTVTCNLGALASGATSTITLVAKLSGTVGQALSHSASATESGPGDGNSANNTSTVTTTVVR